MNKNTTRLIHTFAYIYIESVGDQTGIQYSVQLYRPRVNMAVGRYLLLLLLITALVSPLSAGRGHDNTYEDDDHDNDSSDMHDHDGDSDDHDDEDSSDDSDYDYHDDDDDDDKGSCPGKAENHICCDEVTHVVTVTKWVEHPCNGSEDYRSERRYGGQPVCYKKITIDVAFQFCTKVCCDGWVKDEYGRCTIAVTEDHTILCENGGTPDPDGNTYCLCTNEFTGRQCETAVCSPDCDNGGQCIAENGHSTCLCAEGFTGTRCETPVCPKKCKNGGSCVSHGYYSTCECAPGYTGRTCSHEVRPGTCPSVRDMGDPRATQAPCSFDDDCSGNDKCCRSKYGKHCVTPGEPTCLHDGKHYKEGETFNRSSCEKCTCIRPSILHHNEDEFACYTIDCPVISCPDYTYPSNSCCPVCAGTLPREPQISDCPTQAVDVAVQEDKNIIKVEEKFKHIQAHDHQMNVLKVKFSRKYLRSCACNYTELDVQHISVVSEPDAYGRVAYCSFTVKVVDVHSPKFRRCPSMISAFTDQKISWIAPSATDNVGVREVNLRSKYGNNTMFPKGKHYIEYSAKDFHENVAVCRIPVSVYERDTTDPSLPIGMRMTSTEKQKHTMYIGIGLGAAALLVLLLLGTIYCRHVRSSVPRLAPPVKAKESEAFDNGIYSGQAVYPPPYDNIAFKGDKQGPPSYQPGTPPPVYRASTAAPEYESIAGVPSVASGVDNQMYMDESLYHSLEGPPSVSDKGEKSPPPSYRGVPNSPNNHYEELNVKSVADKAVYDKPAGNMA